ncbi:hypothetical protein [Pedobacter terrae]|uniref:hypothetical protein n=1 Tax=Pedobacter terrae TaxID=405671 RepID=UPI002FF5F418
MAKDKNEHSILFLFEGDTEGEFYQKFFNLNIPPRSVRINKGNLHGVYSLSIKVENKIQAYLTNKDYDDFKSIHVIVAYDREGIRSKQPLLDISGLRKKFISKKSRIKSINHIVATQDLESWFYHDIEGIYKYLKVPTNERKYKFSQMLRVCITDLFLHYSIDTRNIIRKAKELRGLSIHSIWI